MTFHIYEFHVFAFVVLTFGLRSLYGPSAHPVAMLVVIRGTMWSLACLARKSDETLNRNL